GNDSPGALEFVHQRVDRVVGSEDGDLLSRTHRIAVQVGADRRGQHDAWAIIIFEHQWAFVRPGGQHDLLSAYMPDTFPGDPFTRVLILQVSSALYSNRVVGVVDAGHGGTREDIDVVVGFERFDCLGDPLRSRDIIDGFVGTIQQAAAGPWFFVHQDDASTGFRRIGGSGEPGRTGSDHQYISVDVNVVVISLVLGRVQRTKSTQFGGF